MRAAVACHNPPDLEEWRQNGDGKTIEASSNCQFTAHYLHQ